MVPWALLLGATELEEPREQAAGGGWGFWATSASLSCFPPGSFPGEDSREGHDSGGNCVNQDPEERGSRTYGIQLRDGSLGHWALHQNYQILKQGGSRRASTQDPHS